MDQNNIPVENQAMSSDEAGQITSPNPIIKFVPLIVISLILFIILGSGYILFFAKNTPPKIEPAVRPTATPFVGSTGNTESSPSPQMLLPTTTNATFSGKLAYIKDGDIYQGDFNATSLLVKNSTPAGDHLHWSSKGNYLSWFPKSATSSPSAVTVFSFKDKQASNIFPVGDYKGEVLDYAWSPDETEMAVLHFDGLFHLTIIGINLKIVSEPVKRELSIKEVLWPVDKRIVFIGSDGLSYLNLSEATESELIVSSSDIQHLVLSPDKNNIVYSLGDRKKADLYLLNINDAKSKLINPKPANIDMGSTGLTADVLNNGFIPNMLYIPDSNKLLVGYVYQPVLPLTGIYDLENESFVAVSPFYFSYTDTVLENGQLLGARVNTTISKIPVWQINFFSFSETSKFNIIKVIPDASAPVYFE